jgi:2-C-methyl-D-erythritol 4-phosphate cytidylyltransferase/2-C-methyl-D-erythritol 2,4-cyclodiphosphate synthase
MKKDRKIVGLVLAAGNSQRMGGSTTLPLPKPYMTLNGVPMLILAAQSLAAFPIQPLIRAEDTELYKAAVEGAALSLLPPIEGGKTRAASVLAGLRALEKHAPDIVLIHDAARPFVPLKTIEALLDALEEHDGTAPALPVSDNLKELRGDQVKQFSYPQLVRTQTPQAFNYQRLMEAFQESSLDERDELAILEKIGGKVKLIPGDNGNIKITYPEDLETFALTKTGLGVDSHRFCEGDFIILGGVKIAHQFAIEAHSDGDVVLHALCDSIFGALAEKDLGHHFPNEDEWKDIDSSELLEKALNLMEKKHFTITNTDITIICKSPKIAPHREAIINNLATLLSLPPSAISVKATTTDGLGLTGEGKGLAAQVSTLIKRK